jgi:hypothetical protein
MVGLHGELHVGLTELHDSLEEVVLGDNRRAAATGRQACGGGRACGYGGSGRAGGGRGRTRSMGGNAESLSGLGEDEREKRNIPKICCYPGHDYRVYSTLHVFSPQTADMGRLKLRFAGLRTGA